MAGGTQNNNSGIYEINVTPLVDIILVLLIIFMVTATYIVSPVVKVELPKAMSEDKLKQEKPTLSIYLSKENELALAGVMQKLVGKDTQLITVAELPSWLEKVKNEFPEVQVAIQADKEVPFGKVMGLVDRVKRAGINNFAFNVDPKAADMLQ